MKNEKVYMLKYQAPSVEEFEIRVESGFAQSTSSPGEYGDGDWDA